MKNNPKVKYLLIGLAALVWGIIIYKIIDGISANDPVVFAEPVKSLKTNNKNADSFSLIAEKYPDPFLSDIADTAEQIQDDAPTAAIATPNPSPAPVVAATPLQIKYNGYIDNPQNGKCTAIIMINGITRIVSQHDLIAPDTRIIKIQQSSLTIMRDGTQTTVLLGN